MPDDGYGEGLKAPFAVTPVGRRRRGACTTALGNSSLTLFVISPQGEVVHRAAKNHIWCRLSCRSAREVRHFSRILGPASRRSEFLPEEVRHQRSEQGE